MRLSKFVEQHHKKLLTAVVSDMESPQSSHEQSEKSKGRATQGALGTVGHKHAKYADAQNVLANVKAAMNGFATVVKVGMLGKIQL